MNFLTSVSSVYCKKNMTVSGICLPVYIDQIPCEGETGQVQWLIYVCIGATIIRRWVTLNGSELEENAGMRQKIMHATNSVTYNMVNDDESFNREMKWQLGVACLTVSKQEDQNCIVGQQVYGFLCIAYSLIFGLKWKP